MLRLPRTVGTPTLLLATGFGLVAVSGAAVLAVGPRVIPHGSFSGISIAWVVSVVFGFGVATPTEQLISRRRNAGDSARGRSPAYWLAVAAALTVAAVLVLVGATEVGHRYPLLAWSVLAVVGWALVSPRRGDLLGCQAMSAYAATMMLEGALRVLLVVLAAAWGGAARTLLGLSIGLPIVVSAAVAHLLLARHERASTATGVAPGFEHVSFVAIALGYQISINLPPLALSWKVSEQNRDFVGAFVVANSWMRVPTILVGTITVSALVELSRVVPTGSVADFRHVVRRSGAACLALAVGGALLCLLTAHPATTLLYGARVTLPSYGFACLAASTLLAIVGSWLSVPLMALRRSATAAWVWGIGSALVVATLVTLSPRRMVTVGLVVPLLATTAFLTVAALRRFRSWAAEADAG
jgi:O-antigen/teichoic acid export membrane protein